jgi:drug/metabolite transporter (DMT)-like permease
MLPLGLALLSGLTWGSADFLGGLMSKRLHTATVMAVSQGAGLALTAAVVVALGEAPPPARSIAFGVAGGVVGSIGLAALYRGLAVGRMSIVAPTAALSGAVPVLVGFLQGERPAAVQVAGMALAGAGVVLAVRAPDPGSDGRRVRGVGYGLIAAVFLGLFVTCLDAAGEASPWWASLTIRLVSVPIFVVAALATARRARRPTARETGVLVGVGALDNSANVLFAFASREGLLTLVSVLGSLYPVATVLLARWFLHERMARWQIVGVAGALTGVALIAAG